MERTRRGRGDPGAPVPDLRLQEPLGVLQDPAGAGVGGGGEHAAARHASGVALGLQLGQGLAHGRAGQTEVAAQLELAGQALVDREVAADDVVPEDAEQLLLACIVLSGVRLPPEDARACQCLLQCTPAIVLDAPSEEASVAGMLVQGVRQHVQGGFDHLEEVDAVGRGEGGGAIEARERAQGGEQHLEAAHMAEGVFCVCQVARVDQQLAHAAEGVALGLQRI